MEESAKCMCSCQSSSPETIETRRGFIAKAAALLSAGQLLAMNNVARAAEDGDEKAARQAAPQAGDRLTYLAQSRRGDAITPADLEHADRQVLALPVDQETGIVRDGSRFNQIMLTKFDPSELSDGTSERAAEGIVAYSAMCTHDACAISSWDGEKMHYVCPCHQSIFDPRSGGNIVSGPAYRPLPALPLKIEDGVLVVAGPFTARVGGGR